MRSLALLSSVVEPLAASGVRWVSPMLNNNAERRSFALAGLLTCTQALRNLGLLDRLRSPRSRLALSVESPHPPSCVCNSAWDLAVTRLRENKVVCWFKVQ